MKRWDKHAIKAEIHRRGKTLTGLALAYGLEASAVRTALRRPFPAGEDAIADFLGVPRRVLWPRRSRRTLHLDPSAAGRGAASPIGGAA